MRRRTVVVLGLIAVVAAGLGLAGAREASLEARFTTLRDAMADRNYPEADRLAQELVAAHPGTPRAEEAAVLRIRAFAGMKRWDETVRLALGFLDGESHAESAWREKVRFLMADAHARARGFRDAARIYRARVETLAADDHQQAIANDYLEIANAAYEGRIETDRFGRETRVKDHARAREFYLKARAVHDDPETRDVLRHRIADCAAELGDHDRAVAEWTALLEESKSSDLRDEATFRIGKARLDKGDAPTARVWLKKVVDDFPDSPRAPEARILLGASYRPLETGDTDALRAGLAWWEEFARLHFSHEKAPRVFFDIAAAHARHGEHQAALEALAAFLDRFGEHELAPKARYAMGEEELARREFDRAIAHFKAFLGQWPNHELWTKAQEMIVEADYRKGELPFSEKRWDAASDGYVRFLETHPLAPKAPLARLRLGEIAFARDRFDDAIAEFRILAGKYPEHGLARQALLRIAQVVERKKGDHEAALEAYEEVVKTYPRSHEARAARQAVEQMKAKRLVVSTERAFRTDRTPVLHAELRNIERLKFKAYRLDLEEYFRRKHRVASVEDVVVAIVKADPEWTHELAEYRPYVPETRDLDLARLAGPGSWILTCTEEDLTATSLVVVSDLQVVLKQSPHQVFAFVVNERTGEPVPGARVLLGDGEGVFAEGETGPDGTWIFEDDKTERRDVRAFAAHEGHVATCGGVSGGGTSWGYRTKAFLYTDRPLYRPGQEMKFRAIVRKVAGGDYATPVGETVKLRVTDPRGTVLLEEEMTTSDYGTLDGSLLLPDEAHLGDYTLHARYRDHDFQVGFKVMEYRKPEFTASIRTVRPTYLTGQTVEADVSLRYTFGGAVAGTAVRWQVLRMPYEFDADALRSFAWFFSDPARAEERRRAALGALEPVAEGVATTDVDGRAALSFDTEAVEEDRAYVIAVRAQDVNREWISDQKTVFVTQKGYFAVVRPDRKVYRPREKVTVAITTVDARQAPVAARGKLVVLRRTASVRRDRSVDDARVVRLSGGTPYEVVDTVEGVETLADGKGTAAFRIERAGEYVLRFEGKDARGGVVTASAPVDVSGEAEDLAKQAKIVAEQEIYMEGDVAKVLVNTPRAPALALLTYEGEKVLAHRIVRLTSRSTTLELPMEARFSPNVFLRVTIPADGELYEDEDEVAVLKFLRVEVSADRAEARPGDTVTAHVKATDQKGRPVAAELSLAVVDSALFALAPDATPDIKPTFYDQRRKNAVVTSSSHAFAYAGITRPTNKDLLEEESRRLGAEQHAVLRRYVREGKEALDSGDYAKAAVMLGRALELNPGSYEARALVVTLANRAREKSESKNEVAADAKVALERLKRLTSGADAAPAMEPEASAGAPAEAQGWAAKGGGAGGRFDRRSRDKNGKDFDRYEEEAELADDAPGARPSGGLRVGMSFGSRADRLPLDGLVAHERQEALMPATLRRTFADTALWSPAVRTDEDGEAEVEVVLPDNLTTWRLTARGVSRETLVGEGRGAVLARKPLLVRVDTPRFLTQGDRTTITSTVHNGTGGEADVRLDLDARGVDLAGSSATSATIRDGGARVFDWTLDARDIGLVRLEATARSARGSDAMRHGLRTLPFGLPHRDGRSGVVDGEAFETLERPETVVPGTLRFALSISPDVDATLFEAIGELEVFPYGCVEQTINRFLPAIAAHEAVTALGVPDEGLKRRLARAVDRGLNALYALQHRDGSFGWWAGGRGDAAMTAFATIALERSRLAGFRVNDRNRQRARAACTRLLRGGTNRQKAFLLRALALGGDADLDRMNAVYRHRDGLDAVGLAVLALAFRDADRSYNAHELVRMLQDRAVRDGELARWTAGDRDRHGAFLDGDVEATAYALRALLAVEPRNALVDPAARWLESRRRGAGWGTTKATGAAVRALAGWQKTRRAARHDFTVEVWWNGELYQKVAVRGDDPTRRARVVLLDAARFRTGRNELKLVRVGSGSFRYALDYRYVTPAESIPAAGNLVELERTYVEHLSPLAEKSGGGRVTEGWTIVRPEARPEAMALPTLERAGTGDRFRVNLALTAREDLDYVIVEDPLPGGVEVVEGQAHGPFDHAERRDEKQVFFLSHVKAGARIEISYLCQAIHPGRYRALPAVAYPMYEPEVYGRAAACALEVAEESGLVGRTPAVENRTPDAVFALAKRAFDEERWEDARAAFAGLVREYRLLDAAHEECLWRLMKCAFALDDARGAVESFEALRERNPRRGVSTREEKLALAASYFEIGEFERALVRYRGLADELFGQEAEVAEIYRGLGDAHRAQDRMAELVRRSPDSGTVIAAEFELARRWLDLPRPVAEKDDDTRPRIGGPALMLPEALEAFRAFAAHHPEHPEADTAGYMAVAALQRMDLLDAAVAEAEDFRRRYPDSVRLAKVTYDLCLTYFDKGDFENARRVGRELLTREYRYDAARKDTRPSGFRPNVTFLMGQMAHTEGRYAEAVKFYEQVKDRFPDARDALEFFTEAGMRLPESVVCGLDEPASVKVETKNLESLSLAVYEVDLMILFAVRKDLQRINEIDLTGIVPIKEWTVALGDRRDHRWREERVPVPADHKGVYLVVAKGGDHDGSTVVIKSDLEIKVQRVDDRVRVYALHRRTGEPMREVYVKVSDGSRIVAQGLTDTRGVFEARGVRGTASVVAEKDGHHALDR